MRLYYIFIFLLLVTFPAYSYIDPGTGSMLLYAFVGIVAAALYAVKGVYYRFKYFFTGKAVNTDNDLRKYEIVLFSEGKQYWIVFSSVVKALENLSRKCIYISSDKDDPGLKYNSTIVDSLYIGNAVKSSVFLNNMKANLVVMTTPQLDILTIRRSKSVKHYTHIFHAPTDIGIYGRYAFDCFDSILCSGPHQKENLIRFEEMRGTAKKELYETGYTPFDVMLKKKLESEKKGNEIKTILLAPTWNKNSLLTRFEMNIIKPLLNRNYKIILRPHPQMYVSQKDLIKKLKKETAEYSEIIWDENPSGETAMTKSDILISDLSGIIFEYSFMYKKPVITIDAPVETIGLEADDMDLNDIWELNIREKLGKLVDESELDKLPDFVEELITDFDLKDINLLIEKSFYNFGSAGDTAAEQLIKISEGLSTV